jgi:hypothetical protein
MDDVPAGFSCDSVRGIHHGEDLWFYHAVVHIPAIAPVCHQPSFTQHHQVLGDIRLPQAKHGFHVAYALFAIPQNIQDCQADRVHQCLEKSCFELVFFHGYITFNLLNVILTNLGDWVKQPPSLFFSDVYHDLETRKFLP